MGKLGTYTDRTASAMITGPQLGFLTSLTRDKITLVAQMNGRPVDTDALDATIAALSGLTKSEASQAIGATKEDLTTLRQAARYSSATVEAPVSSAPVVELDTDGIYVIGEDYYRVQRSGAGRLYAKRLNTDTRKWEYAPGMVGRITPDTRLTADQAAALPFSWCIRCGADLTREQSISQRMGDICYGKSVG